MNTSRSQQAKKKCCDKSRQQARARARGQWGGRAGVLLGKRDWDVLVVKGPC